MPNKSAFILFQRLHLWNIERFSAKMAKKVKDMAHLAFQCLLIMGGVLGCLGKLLLLQNGFFSQLELVMS